MGNYILADNQELTRFAIERLIRQDGRNTVCRATNRAQLVQLLRDDGDAVVVLDYTLFDFVDEEQLLIVGERFAAARWVLISDELTPKFLRRVIYSSRQFSVVFKDSSLNDVRAALRSATSGQRFVCQRAKEVIIARRQEEECPAVLTATEIEIVRSIAQGKTTKEIAAERFLSVHTVSTHRKNIFRKLGVNTAYEAVKYGLRAGWVDPGEFYII